MHQDVKYDFTANLTGIGRQVGREIIFDILVHPKLICDRSVHETSVSFTVSQKTSHLWLAITLTHMNGF